MERKLSLLAKKIANQDGESEPPTDTDQSTSFSEDISDSEDDTITDSDFIDDLPTEEILPRKLTAEEKRKIRLTCEICGKTFIKRNRKQHERTKFHISHASINQELLALLRPKTMPKKNIDTQWKMTNGGRQVFREETSEGSEIDDDLSSD